MKTVFRLLIVLLSFAGCKKSGDMIEHSNYGILTLKLEYAVDADNVYKVELQDNLFTDGLNYANESKRAVNNRKYIITQDKKHFVVYDQNQQKVLDTLLTLKVSDQISLIQLQPGGPPSILSSSSGGDVETDPEPGKTKVRFTYDDPLLPDSIRLKIYSVSSNDLYTLWDYSVDPPTHLFTDSAVVKAYKNNFSAYIQLDYQMYSPDNPQYIMEVYDLKTGDVIQQTVMVDYWFIPGLTTKLVQIVTGLNPTYKFLNIKIKSAVIGGLTTGDMIVFQDDFMYGIPW